VVVVEGLLGLGVVGMDVLGLVVTARSCCELYGSVGRTHGTPPCDGSKHYFEEHTMKQTLFLNKTRVTCATNTRCLGAPERREFVCVRALLRGVPSAHTSLCRRTKLQSALASSQYAHIRWGANGDLTRGTCSLRDILLFSDRKLRPLKIRCQRPTRLALPQPTPRHLIAADESTRRAIDTAPALTLRSVPDLWWGEGEVRSNVTQVPLAFSKSRFTPGTPGAQPTLWHAACLAHSTHARPTLRRHYATVDSGSKRFLN